MIRLELMRSTPLVKSDDGLVAEIKGRQRELFRLLVLRGGKTVDREAIAQLRDTEIDATASKIRYLRKDLPKWINPHELIRSEPGDGYRIDLRHCAVDATEFQTTIERITGGAAFRPLAHSIPQDVAYRDVKDLGNALALWEANPADGLPAEAGLEAWFERLKARAEDRLVLSRLYTKDRSEIREAIQYLAGQARRGDADDLTWRLLLLAYDALGNVTGINKTIDDISKLYRGRIPTDLQNTMSGINGGEHHQNPFSEQYTPARASVPLGETPTQQTGNPETDIRVLCDQLGITTASRLRLIDSSLTPLACIRRTRQRLNFSGVLASKWVMDAGVRSEFDQLLSRLDANGGAARFLMINPNGDGYRRLSELRKGQISFESVAPLRALAAAHPSLEVRAFNNLPSFRIVIIDDDVVGFSPYRLAAETYVATERGWEAPHVVLDPIARYPLSEAFQILFDESWNCAIPLEDI